MKDQHAYATYAASASNSLSTWGLFYLFLCQDTCPSVSCIIDTKVSNLCIINVFVI